MNKKCDTCSNILYKSVGIEENQRVEAICADLRTRLKDIPSQDECKYYREVVIDYE